MAIPDKSCTHDFTSFIPNQLDQLTGFSLHLEYLATCQRQNCVWGTWNAFLLRVLTLDPPWSLLVAIQSLLRINCGPFHLLSLGSLIIIPQEQICLSFNVRFVFLQFICHKWMEPSSSTMNPKKHICTIWLEI